MKNRVSFGEQNYLQSFETGAWLQLEELELLLLTRKMLSVALFYS